MDVSEESLRTSQWHARCAELHASGARMLDFIAAVDDPTAGEIEVVAHLVDVARRHRHLLRVRVARDAPRVDSLVDLWPGAGWHEREAHELVGVEFVGNPDLRPLLTQGEFTYPLRRTTPLPRRVTTAWPGAVEPSDRPATGQARVAARSRATPTPPGVPPEWES